MDKHIGDTCTDDAKGTENSIEGVENTRSEKPHVTFSIPLLMLDMLGVVLLVIGYLELSGTKRILPDSLSQPWLPFALVIVGLALMLPLGFQVFKKNFTSVKVNNK